MKKSTMKWLVAAVCMLLVVVAVVPSFAGTLGSATVVGGRDGKDGKDGVDGKDGKDGLTPIFRVNSQTSEWEYSYTGGLSWLSLGVKAGDKYDAYNKLNPEYIDQAWYANFGQTGGGDLVVISQQTLTSGMWSKLQMDIQPGIDYDVYINGERYTCTACAYGSKGVILGNNMELTANDLPFCLYWAGGSATSGMFFNDSSLSYPLTLKVTDAYVDTYNKLPIEYLPEELLTVADVEELIKNAGSGIDVVAKPGQTIIVKEVDANGKPTKWESAEYQERTHWKTETEILPKTTGVLDEESGNFILPLVQLTGGAQYKIVYNGVEYVSECLDTGEGEILFGNIPMMVETGDNGIPFLGAMVTDDEGSYGLVMPIDGAETVTISIVQVEYTPIPEQYLANTVYYIDVTGSGTTDDPYVCKETVQELARIYNSGRQMVARMGVEEDGVAAYFCLNLIFGRTDGLLFMFNYYMGSAANLKLIFQSADGITYNIVGND